MTERAAQLEVALLDVREACSPSAQDRARVAGALFAAIAAGTASSTVLSVEAAVQARAAGGAPLLGAKVGLKLAAGLVMVSAVAAGAWFATRAPAPKSAAPERPAAAVSSVHDARGATGVVAQSAAANIEPAGVVVDAPMQAPAAPDGMQPMAAALPAAPTAARVRSHGHPAKPSAGRLAGSTQAGAEPAQTKSEPAAVSVSAVAAADPGPQLAEELVLIRRAAGALRRADLATADAALVAHATRFPSGALAKERTALGLLVRCARGSSPGLAAERDAFLRAAGGSPLAERVRRACTPVGASSTTRLQGEP